MRRHGQTSRKTLPGRAPRKTLHGGLPGRSKPAQAIAGGKTVYEFGGSVACTYVVGHDAESELGDGEAVQDAAMVPLSIADAEVQQALPFVVTRQTKTVRHSDGGDSVPVGEVQAQFAVIADRMGRQQLVPPDKAQSNKREGGSYAVIWRHEDGSLYTQFETEQTYPGLKKALTDGQLVGCEARGDLRTGTFAVFATGDITAHAVIGVETGVLWTTDRYEAAEAADHELDRLLGIHATDIIAKDLAGVGYTGPDLVLEITAYANECKFLNDPSWAHSDGSREANVQGSLVFDARAALPRIAYFATRNITAGEELFVDWGDRTWAGICTSQLVGQARMSKALWAQQKQLEAAYLDQFGDDLGELPAPRILPAAEKQVVYFDESNDGSCSLVPTDGWLASIQKGEAVDDDNTEDDAHAPLARARQQPARFEAGAAPSTRTQRFKSVQTSDAFQRADCTYNNTLDMADLEDTVAIQAQLKALYPAVLDDIDESCQSMMEPGFQTSIEVIEVVDETHPARVFTPPDCTAFGLKATKSFVEDEPIMAYHGKVVRAETASTENFYLYDMTAGLEGYDGPTLCIDPRTSGNEARFVNDAWKPEGMSHAKANAYAKLVWCKKTHLPHVFFLAGKDIRKGEEILIDYGVESYWRVCWRALMQEHAHFAAKTQHRCSELEQGLRDLEVTPPVLAIPGMAAPAEAVGATKASTRKRPAGQAARKAKVAVKASRKKRPAPLGKKSKLAASLGW
jgi:hypothetical protein